MKLYCKKRGEINQSDDARSFLEKIFLQNYGDKMPQIKKTPTGKPYFPERQDIHFSISHSKTHVLCALSASPIGVDIESCRPISEKVINYFATAEELKHFHPLDLWVLKESYIKLFGKTMVDIKHLHFTRKNNIIITPDSSVKSRLYRFKSIYIGASSQDDEFPKHIEFNL